MSIYAVRDSLASAVKVGYSDNPSSRLSSLQTANPRTLARLGCIEGNQQEEQALHRELAPYHIRGEWFIWCEHVKECLQQHGFEQIESEPRGQVHWQTYIPTRMRQLAESVTRWRTRYVEAKQEAEHWRDRYRELEWITELLSQKLMDIRNDKGEQ